MRRRKVFRQYVIECGILRQNERFGAVLAVHMLSIHMCNLTCVRQYGLQQSRDLVSKQVVDYTNGLYCINEQSNPARCLPNVGCPFSTSAAEGIHPLAQVKTYHYGYDESMLADG